MPSKKYFFQQKKRGFAQKFFEKGLTASSYILLALKEAGEGFLSDLPDSYPQFALMKQMFGVGKYKKHSFKKETLVVNLQRLMKKGLVAKEPKKKVYYLTDEGEELVAYIKDRYSILKEPWDGKLRIVAFDIPEEKEYWRRWFRQELILLQFHQLQKSVYIGKSALPESLYKEINENGLSPFIFVLTVGEIDKKEEIMKIFEND